jgi:lantibiotic modifying enzyme
MRSEAAPFLEVAGALGRRLADTAVWYRGRCNWTGTSLPGASGQRIESALAADLYGGTAGVAVFLAEAACTLREERLRATALGAIRHALRHADRSLSGLYGGTLGVAYAAARVGARLGDERAHHGAGELVRAWRRGRPAAPRGFDLMGGTAGTVAGLVALASMVEDPGLVARAAAEGDALLACAETAGTAWSWAPPGRRRMHNLCGFAHGAAGAGHALIELFAATGDARFRQAGEGAFDYERSWVHPRSGTWPDLVGVARTAGRDAPVPPTVSWCQGAAGTAVARARATRLLGRADADGELALSATRDSVTRRLTLVPDDFCLCHGLAGAADALLYAGEGAALAADVGRLGIERFHEADRPFPSGLPEGNTPGLFRGLAGVGLFYLRLADPAIPTVLMISRLDPGRSRA